jgi:hypothetical protein
VEKLPETDTLQLPDRERWLAETYDDGVDSVREYRAAVRWKTAHPKQGSHVASRALELPRGRLRTWFDGGKPDAVRAIDTAESLGWLDTATGEPIFEGLSVLHAWVLAGGSIAKDSFVPSLAVGTGDPDELAREAFRVVGIPSKSVNEGSTKRAHELRPKGEGGSHLGRFLYGVFGAPIGGKTRIGAEPLGYLTLVPKTTLRRWCQTYVTLRGVPVDSAQGGHTVRLGEQRSQAYRRALARLFREVAGEDAQITVTRRATLLGTDTLDMLDVIPSLPPSV